MVMKENKRKMYENFEIQELNKLYLSFLTSEFKQLIIWTDVLLGQNDKNEIDMKNSFKKYFLKDYFARFAAHI